MTLRNKSICPAWTPAHSGRQWLILWYNLHWWIPYILQVVSFKISWFLPQCASCPFVWLRRFYVLIDSQLSRRPWVVYHLNHHCLSEWTLDHYLDVWLPEVTSSMFWWQQRAAWVTYPEMTEKGVDSLERGSSSHQLQTWLQIVTMWHLPTKYDVHVNFYLKWQLWCELTKMSTFFSLNSCLMICYWHELVMTWSLSQLVLIGLVSLSIEPGNLVCPWTYTINLVLQSRFWLHLVAVNLTTDILLHYTCIWPENSDGPTELSSPQCIPRKVTKSDNLTRRQVLNTKLRPFFFFSLLFIQQMWCLYILGVLLFRVCLSKFRFFLFAWLMLENDF